MTDVVLFDEDRHAYTYAGVPVPGVTTILGAARDPRTGAPLVDRTWFTPEARERGTSVHLATAALDRGTFDAAAWPADVLARVNQYQVWKAVARPRWEWIEASFGGPLCGGTLDRGGRLPGWPRFSIVDLKCGPPAEWHALQLAGYALLSGQPDAHRWTLHLEPDRWRLVPHRNPLDLARFQQLARDYARAA